MKKRFQKLSALCLAVLLTVFLLPGPALAIVLPERPENLYVMDSAGVLSEDTEQEIIRENQKLFEKTGAEIVVVAVDFLDGEEMDDYVYMLFNSWGIGSEERNNGILLVLAVGEENYYAQSGLGIEDYFDGALLDRILDENLEPDFAAGDYDAGVKKTFEALLAEVESYYAEFDDSGWSGSGDEDDFFDPWGEEDSYGEGSIFSGLIKTIVKVVFLAAVVVIIIAVIRAFSRGGGGGPGGSGGGGNFWSGLFLGRMIGGRRARVYRAPPPPGRFGGFGGPPPGRPGGGFGGFGGHTGGFSGGGRSHTGGSSRGGFSGGSGGHSSGHSGGFSHGGSSRGGGAGRR